MLFLLLSLASVAHAAAINCQAIRFDPRGGSVEKPLVVGSDGSSGIYTASTAIQDAYYHIQGMIDRNRYTLAITLDAPKPNGTSIFSDGAFDGDGYMRSSFVREGIVYKMICQKK